MNLHAALLRLRDHCFERVLWVDAICIDQKNPKEQGQQVQLMARIYSSANRVIVWLGEETEETKGALDDLLLAARGEFLEEELKKEAIFNLLQSPWFQRIWVSEQTLNVDSHRQLTPFVKVLQEVAAARHVVMMCGSTELDGHAFCMGVLPLELPYSAIPKLQSLPSLIKLMEGACIRTKYTSRSPEEFSLDVNRLAELLDMFHTREASDMRDKVYALLGMSSDNPSRAGLQSDYEIPWRALFQKLIEYVLGQNVVVEVAYDPTNTQRATIKGQGRVLGEVLQVARDANQNVIVTIGLTNYSNKEWIIQPPAKSIEVGDIACILEGASVPVIVRMRKDFGYIIVIAVNSVHDETNQSMLELCQEKTTFPRYFLLLWDWGKIEDELPSQEDLERNVSFDQAMKMGSVAMILGDLQNHTRALMQRRAVLKGYETACGEAQSILAFQYWLTVLPWAARYGHEDVVKFIVSKDGIDPDVKDNECGRTPLSWAAGNDHVAVVKLLIATSKVDIDSIDDAGQTPFSWVVKGEHWAFKKEHWAVIKLLLETGDVQLDVDSKDSAGRSPLLLAAWKRWEAVVQILVEKENVDLNSEAFEGMTPWLHAASYGRSDIVKILLATGKVEADPEDTMLFWAAKNGHHNIVSKILAIGNDYPDAADETFRTPLSWAAERGHGNTIKLLLERGKVRPNTRDTAGRTPLSYASEGGREDIVRLLLETGKVNVESRDIRNKTPISYASAGGYKTIVELLLAALEAQNTANPPAEATSGNHESYFHKIKLSKFLRKPRILH